MSRGVRTSVLTPDRGVGCREMRTPEDVMEMRQLPGLGLRADPASGLTGGPRVSRPRRAAMPA